VAATVTRSPVVAYMGRKHYNSQNLLVAIDFGMKFTHVSIGWEGLFHDASILCDSLNQLNGFNIPKDSFYLGDAGYACHPGVFPPFRSMRCHLNE
jgi:hypothetical protein